MYKKIKLLTVFAVVMAFAASAWVTTVSLAKGKNASANGSGTQLITDEQGNTVRRQFNFNAKQNADGTVSGQAIVRNPAFTGADGKIYTATINISCLSITGNRAVVGGTIKKTNDPNLTDSAFFVVEDNGEPGKYNDGLSGIAFSSEIGPEQCGNIETSNFALFPIDSGNIQVTGETAK